MLQTKNKTRRKQSYHHGNLAQELVTAAVAHIQTHGIEQLSLRDLAREMGVSHGAPYRHFVDKRALLAAIAEEGFKILFAELQHAVAKTEPSVLKQIENMSWTYVKFGLEHPVYLNLMFGTEFADKTDHGTLEDSSDAVLEFAKAIIENGQKEKVLKKGDVLVQTTALWSTVHGLAVLLGGQCMHDEEYEVFTPEQLTRRTVAMLFSGLAR